MNLRKVALYSVLIVVTGASLYVGNYFYERQARLSPAHPDALRALQSTDRVTVIQDDWITFMPTQVSPTRGFIFYPGGECDERGYAELMHAIAAQGFVVVLVPMPLQLAVLSPDKAADVMAAYPQVTKWAISGHSLGGAMAARYVYRHPGELAGLLLWDAYPPKTDDISARTLPVTLIHRADASGQPPDNYGQYLHLLPKDTGYRPIPGGNHINFGHFLPADRFAADAASATIPLEQQHAEIVSYTVAFLESM